MEQLRIATYNVHGWVDSHQISNLDKVVEVVNQQDPDILSLQEVYPCWELPCLLEFMRKTKFVHSARWDGCAVLSKAWLPLDDLSAGEDPLSRTVLSACPGYGYKRPRYLPVRVNCPGGSHFYLTCLHLSPKYSDKRLEEIRTVAADLNRLANLPQIWLGDFNSLNQTDYSNQEWTAILEERRQNGRELPTNHVTQAMEELGFSDCWIAAGRPQPRTTSRFNTRVDYVCVSPEFKSQWRLEEVTHVVSNASDHNLVMATFAPNSAASNGRI